MRELICDIALWSGLGAVIGVVQWSILRKQAPEAIWWPIATSLGYSIGYIVGTRLAKVLDLNLAFLCYDSVVTGAVMGAVVGVAQSFALQLEIAHSVSLILATSIGCSIGHEIYSQREFLNFSPFAATLIFGTAIAVAQWVVMRRYIERASCWILATALGLEFGFWIGIILCFVVSEPVIGLYLPRLPR